MWFFWTFLASAGIQLAIITSQQYEGLKGVILYSLIAAFIVSPTIYKAFHSGMPGGIVQFTQAGLLSIFGVFAMYYIFKDVLIMRQYIGIACIILGTILTIKF